MKGFPKSFKTRHDLLVGIDYCRSHPTDKPKMVAVLENIRRSTQMYVLKDEARGKDAEELTQEDYYLADDPDCTMRRMGLTEEDIDNLIKEVA